MLSLTIGDTPKNISYFKQITPIEKIDLIFDKNSIIYIQIKSNVSKIQISNLKIKLSIQNYQKLKTHDLKFIIKFLLKLSFIKYQENEQLFRCLILTLVEISISNNFMTLLNDIKLPNLNIQSKISTISDGINFFDYAFFDYNCKSPNKVSKSSSDILTFCDFGKNDTIQFKRLITNDLLISPQINLIESLNDNQMKDLNIYLVDIFVKWYNFKQILTQDWFAFFKFTYSELFRIRAHKIIKSKLFLGFKESLKIMVTNSVFKNSALSTINDPNINYPLFQFPINPFQMSRNYFIIAEILDIAFQKQKGIFLIPPKHILDGTWKNQVSLTELFIKTRRKGFSIDGDTFIFKETSTQNNPFHIFNDFLINVIDQISVKSDWKNSLNIDELISLFTISSGIRNNDFIEGSHILKLSLDILVIMASRDSISFSLDQTLQLIESIDNQKEIDLMLYLSKLLLFLTPGWDKLPSNYKKYDTNQYWEVIEKQLSKNLHSIKRVGLE